MTTRVTRRGFLAGMTAAATIPALVSGVSRSKSRVPSRRSRLMQSAVSKGVTVQMTDRRMMLVTLNRCVPVTVAVCPEIATVHKVRAIAAPAAVRAQ